MEAKFKMAVVFSTRRSFLSRWSILLREVVGFSTMGSRYFVRF